MQMSDRSLMEVVGLSLELYNYDPQPKLLSNSGAFPIQQIP